MLGDHDRRGRRQVDHLARPRDALTAQQVPALGAALQGMVHDLGRLLTSSPGIVPRVPLLARSRGLLLLSVGLHERGRRRLALLQFRDPGLQLRDQVARRRQVCPHLGILCLQGRVRGAQRHHLVIGRHAAILAQSPAQCRLPQI
jgi:hypothetical protein